MIEPRKIRVLYFDESPHTLVKFINNCRSREIIEIVGTFRSFAEVAPILEQEDYHFIEGLFPDVIVIRMEKPDLEICRVLSEIRRRFKIKLVGLLSGRCLEDRNFIKVFDYHTLTFGETGFLTEEDMYTHLIYQIKTARLASNTEKAGVRGKWAILPLPPKPTRSRRIKMIAIGASAGGTEAVSKILSALPAELPPVLLVQHIPENFTEFFARNLAGKIPMKVIVAHGGERLEDGTVYLAGYDKHLEIIKSEDGDFYTKCTHRDKVSGHRPSVDVMFSSLAESAGAVALGIILTGMGNDGAQGLLEMRESGAYTIGQDKATSAVYGMPMVAYTIGAVSKQLPLDAIAKEIISVTSENKVMETNNG